MISYQNQQDLIGIVVACVFVGLILWGINHFADWSYVRKDKLKKQHHDDAVLKVFAREFMSAVVDFSSSTLYVHRHIGGLFSGDEGFAIAGAALLIPPVLLNVSNVKKQDFLSHLYAEIGSDFKGARIFVSYFMDGLEIGRAHV